MGKLLSLVAALVVTGAVAPGLASAQAPTEDSAVVSGFEPGGLGADIDASSGPSGENPTGDVVVHIGGGSGPTWFGTVTCLAVSGNTAVIGFVGTFIFFGSDEPFAGLIRVSDAGGPGSSQDSFEGPAADPATSPTPNCAAFAGGGPVFSVFGTYPDGSPAGDIVVTDAQPFPSATAQCKNGGWKTYGVFGNQGDCVSFVATGGRNQPSGP